MWSNGQASRTSYAYYGMGADWLKNTWVFCILPFITILLLDPLPVLKYLQYAQPMQCAGADLEKFSCGAMEIKWGGKIKAFFKHIM